MKKKTTKKRSAARGTKPPVEHDVAKAQDAHESCKACDVGSPTACPFCSKEGLVLIALAIVLVAINHTVTRYLAWACLLVAFLIPLIKRMVKKE